MSNSVGTTEHPPVEGRERKEQASARLFKAHEAMMRWVSDVTKDPVKNQAMMAKIHAGMITLWGNNKKNVLKDESRGVGIRYSHHENIEGSLYITFSFDGQGHEIRFRWAGDNYVYFDGKNKMKPSTDAKMNLGDIDGQSICEWNDDGVRVVTNIQYPTNEECGAYTKTANMLRERADTVGQKISAVLLGLVGKRTALQQEQDNLKFPRSTYTYGVRSYDDAAKVMEIAAEGLELASKLLNEEWQKIAA